MGNSKPLRKKIKCPICNIEFIPVSFSLEKTDHKSKEYLDKNIIAGSSSRQIKIQPFTKINKFWVTYCPNCNYSLKFIAQLFKKSKIINQEEKKNMAKFGEFSQTYYYKLIDYEKPYMDSLDYFTEKLEEIYNEIINAISKTQLEKYGEIYKEWKSKDGIDSFKFLIRLISILDDQYKENFKNDIKKEMPEKINELTKKFEMSYSLREELIEVNSLRNKLVHDGYEINQEENNKIDQVIQNFTFEILYSVLKPLNLDKRKITDGFNLYDNNQINKEIGFFLSSYVSNLIRFNNMTKDLINPLVEKLGIVIKK